MQSTLPPRCQSVTQWYQVYDDASLRIKEDRENDPGRRRRASLTVIPRHPTRKRYARGVVARACRRPRGTDFSRLRAAGRYWRFGPKTDFRHQPHECRVAVRGSTSVGRFSNLVDLHSTISRLLRAAASLVDDALLFRECRETVWPLDWMEGVQESSRVGWSLWQRGV